MIFERHIAADEKRGSQAFRLRKRRDQTLSFSLGEISEELGGHFIHRNESEMEELVTLNFRVVVISRSLCTRTSLLVENSPRSPDSCLFRV